MSPIPTRSRLACAMIAVFLAAPAVVAKKLDRSSVLPTVACGDYYLVQMQVSGDPDRMLSMLLDTGASYTVIDTESVARVAGKPIPEGRRARFDKLVAGQIEFSGLRAKVLQLDHLQRALGAPMDGILGFPAFEDVLLTIDYPAAEVRVRSGSLPSPDGSRLLRTIKEKRRPLVRLDFGAGGRPVLLDSGSSGGFTLEDSDGLRFEKPPVVFDSSLRIDRIMERAGARLSRDVTFGGVALIKPTVVIGESIELVGTTVMKHFVATFDQKRRVVLLERSSSEPIESAALRDVGWSLLPREKGFEIVRVYEGFGAARAGLAAGDLVTAIDGTPIYETNLCDRGPEEREKVDVAVDRDGTVLSFTVSIDTVVP